MLDRLYLDILIFLLNQLPIRSLIELAPTSRIINSALDDSYLRSRFKVDKIIDIKKYLDLNTKPLRWHSDRRVTKLVGSHKKCDYGKYIKDTAWSKFPVNTIRTSQTIKITNIGGLSNNSNNWILIGLRSNNEKKWNSSKQMSAKNCLWIELYKTKTRIIIENIVKKIQTKVELTIKIVLTENIIHFYFDSEYIGSTPLESKSKVLYPEICSSIPATIELID